MSNFIPIMCAMCSEMPRTLFKYARKCQSDRRLDGQVVVITGGNSGVGKETAFRLSFRGAKVIIGARNLEKSEFAINEIKQKNPNADITAFKLDLSSLASVRQFANIVKRDVEKVDILINNAGIPIGPEERTEDMFEVQFGAGYLGHFLLTLHLLPHMRKSSNARIVSVSTSGHIFGQIYFENINLSNGAYSPMRAHLQSKLALVLFTRELARRMGIKSNVKSYVLNPGISNSRPASNPVANFFKSILSLSVVAGAQTSLYCALDEKLDNESGFYYDNCRRVHRMVKQAVDDISAEKLWELSCDLVKLEEEFKI